MSAPRSASAARILTVWQHFWFNPVPPHLYAALRIALGIAGCLIYAGLSDVSAFWDLDGFVSSERGWTGVKRWLLSAGLGWTGGFVLWLSCLAAFACMTVGLWSRVTVPLAFAATIIHHGWNNLPLSGADDVLRALLFCLIWTESGTVWSLDAWRAAQRGEIQASARPMLPIAPLRLMRFQISLIYLSAGLWKLYSPLWRDGSAVHYVLNTNVYHRFPIDLPASLDGLITVLTYATLFWELGFAFLVLYGPARRLVLIGGVLIHAGMFAMIEVGPFHLVMLAGYLAFLDPFRVAAFGTPVPADPLNQNRRPVTIHG